MPTTTTPSTSTDRIEKQVTYDVPRSRVWRALTDVAQFNKWFGVTLTSPFATGAEVSGKFSHPKYERFTMTIWIETMEPLEEVAGGTRLTIVESGFDAIPESRRAKAFSMNSNGWNGQIENIRKFLAA